VAVVQWAPLEEQHLCMDMSGCTQGTRTAGVLGCRREWRTERSRLIPRLSPGRRAAQVFFPYVALYLAAAFLQGGAGTGASGVLNNIRTWLWFSISQSAYRTISLDMFSHVLDLDLKFHLMCEPLCETPMLNPYLSPHVALCCAACSCTRTTLTLRLT